MPFKPSKIALSDSAGIKITDFNKIIYCKAEGNYTRIYMKNYNFIVAKVLKYVENVLPCNIFIRIHRSYMVNLNYITGFRHKNTIILDQNIELPVARRRKTEILKKISKKITII